MIWFKHQDIMLPVDEECFELSINKGKKGRAICRIETNKIEKYKYVSSGHCEIMNNFEIVYFYKAKIELTLIGHVIIPLEGYEYNEQYYEVKIA